MNNVEQKVIDYVKKNVEKERIKQQNGSKNKLFAWKDPLNDLLNFYKQKDR